MVVILQPKAGFQKIDYTLVFVIFKFLMYFRFYIFDKSCVNFIKSACASMETLRGQGQSWHNSYQL